MMSSRLQRFPMTVNDDETQRPEPQSGLWEPAAVSVTPTTFKVLNSIVAALLVHLCSCQSV